MEKEGIITKKQFLEIYDIDRVTFETWKNKYNLPVIEVSTHSKYVRKSDLFKWEESLKRNKIELSQSMVE